MPTSFCPGVALNNLRHSLPNGFAQLGTCPKLGCVCDALPVTVEFDKAIKRVPEVQQVVWVHDEIQVECEAEDAENVGQVAVDAIVNAGAHFNLRIPLTGEYKIGETWADTH